MEIKTFDGYGWIDEEFVAVIYVKAKDIDDDIDKFDAALNVYNPDRVRVSDIHEIYLKYNVGYSEEYGQGFYVASSKGLRGASKYYFAKTKYESSD